MNRRDEEREIEPSNQNPNLTQRRKGAKRGRKTGSRSFAFFFGAFATLREASAVILVQQPIALTAGLKFE
jgi:hypothetical protein